MLELRGEADRIAPARSDAPERLWLVASRLSLAGALAVPLVVFALLFPLVSDFPKWDQWHLTPLWDAHFTGARVLDLLLEPYNGHVNIVPRFVFYGLGLLTDWNMRAEVVASFLCALVTLAALLLMLRDSDPRLLVLALPVAAYVFSITQFVNFLSGYPLGQNLSQMFATLAIYWLTKPDPRSRDVALAGVASLLATFSWGAGLAAWYAGIVLLAFRGRSHRGFLLGAWVAATLLTTLVVRHGATSLPLVLSPSAILAFFAVLLGRPATLELAPSLHGTQLLAVLGLTAFTLALAATLRRGLMEDALRWGGIALLTLGSAGLIAVGRVFAGLPQALSSHYVTATYPLLVATLTLIAILILRAHRGSAAMRLAALGLLAAIAMIPPLLFAIRTLPVLEEWTRINEMDFAKVAAGTATDAEIHRSLHPDAALVRWGTTVLTRHRLATFAEPGISIRKPIALPEPAYHLRWELAEIPPEVVAGEELRVRVVVRNTSSVAWPVLDPRDPARRTGAYAVRLGYFWERTDGSEGRTGEGRIDLASEVAPNEGVSISFVLRAPTAPGHYDLTIDLVQELVAWFGTRHQSPLRVPVQVRDRQQAPARRAA
jgi:hypothetical protein